MLDWVVLALALAYLALLFLIAWAGDRRTRPPGRAPAVYALAIGVYCTSWTLYGAVGVAAEGGLDYLAIYVGPILVMGLGWPLIARMVRIARTENLVSISDFISARYGKSRAVAVVVTSTAAVGLLPYFALQLKAITISFEALAGDVGGLPGGTTLIVAAAMAAFAVLFGVRSVNANEPHRGLMLAVATESVVKLAAALLVGGAVAFFTFGSPGGFAATVRADPDLVRLLSLDALDQGWWATCVLAALAFLCLPRQFHVAVVENTHIDDVRTAAWAFPLYLVAINLFVLPVAVAGLALFPDGGAQPDTFMVAIPRELGWPVLALVAFLGGLSAATGMIIVATLALGTMVSNDLILPLLARHAGLRARWEANPGPALLAARRVAVVGIMALAYLCYLVVAPAFPLAAIGLISFAAVAQFAPALIGGLFWRRATAAGAIAGIGAGFLGWIWAVAVPAFAAAGWLPPDLLADGPAGIGWLSPVALGGLALDPQLHGLLWSIGPNVALYVAVSLATEPTPAELRQAERFVGVSADGARREPPPRAASLADLHELAARYVGRERADAAFRALAPRRRGREPHAGEERRRGGAGDRAPARRRHRLGLGARRRRQPALRPPLLALRRPRADRRGQPRHPRPARADAGRAAEHPPGPLRLRPGVARHPLEPALPRALRPAGRARAGRHQPRGDRPLQRGARRVRPGPSSTPCSTASAPPSAATGPTSTSAAAPTGRCSRSRPARCRAAASSPPTPT